MRAVGRQTSGRHATTAAVAAGDNLRAIDVTGPAAVRRYEQQGNARAVARVQTALGRALRRAGRHTEAREALTAALGVLRTDPDLDTVEALEGLAALENFSGGAGAAAANREAVEMAEGLDAGPRAMASVLIAFGIHLSVASRLVEATMYFERAAELAAQADDADTLGYALLNLANDADHARPGSCRGHAAPHPAGRAPRGRPGDAGDDDHQPRARAGRGSGTGTRPLRSSPPRPTTRSSATRSSCCSPPRTSRALRGEAAAAHEALDRLAALPDTEDPQDRSALAAAAALVAVIDGRPARRGASRPRRAVVPGRCRDRGRRDALRVAGRLPRRTRAGRHGRGR